jgi:hypothetical protein
LSWVGADRCPVGVEPGQEVDQVGGGELPFEWSGCLIVACLEVDESFHVDVDVVEVVGREHLPLSDAEEEDEDGKKDGKKDGPSGMIVGRFKGSAGVVRSCGRTWSMGPRVSMIRPRACVCGGIPWARLTMGTGRAGGGLGVGALLMPGQEGARGGCGMPWRRTDPSERRAPGGKPAGPPLPLDCQGRRGSGVKSGRRPSRSDP